MVIAVPNAAMSVDRVRHRAGVGLGSVGRTIIRACEQGECGSCSVLLDGRLVCSCLLLAAACPGSEVITVEGLAADPVGLAVQNAMIAAGGVQCGFCTPGFVVAITDLLKRHPHPD